MPQLQTAYYTSVIAGGRDIGPFTTFSGGGVTTTAVDDRAPGAEYPTQSGGDKTLAEITVTRPVDITRDTAELEDYLAGLVGVTNGMVVQRKPLVGKLPFGKGTTWTGTLTSLGPTDSDNNSSGSRTTLTLVVAPSTRG